MADLDIALQTLRDALVAPLAASGAITEPINVFIGWPTAQELHEVLHQPGAGGQVTVWPLDGGASDARYHDSLLVKTPTPGTTAAIDSTKQILTFAGTPAAGDNIHAFFSFPLQDAFYQVQSGDTVAAIAAAIRTAALAKGLPGVTITESGAALTMEGAYWQRCNIGSSATGSREINRMDELFQVSIWMPNPKLRQAATDAILTSVGGTNQPFLAMPDGTGLRIAYKNKKTWDKGQQTYSAYRRDLIFAVEYGITQQVAVTTVESVEGKVVTDGGAPATFVTGGS